jgi:hypothetical protein
MHGASRGVKAIARLALTAGAAGTAVAIPTIYELLRQPVVTEAPRGKLTLSAILLSLAFLLAPLVRRTFGGSDEAHVGRRRGSKPTLLDEMREGSGGEDENRSAVDDTTDPTQGVSDGVLRKALVWRLVIAAYVVFAAALLLILWGMQRV